MINYSQSAITQITTEGLLSDNFAIMCQETPGSAKFEAAVSICQSILGALQAQAHDLQGTMQNDENAIAAVSHSTVNSSIQRLTFAS